MIVWIHELKSPAATSTLGLSDHQLVEDLIEKGVAAVHGEDLKISNAISARVSVL